MIDVLIIGIGVVDFEFIEVGSGKSDFKDIIGFDILVEEDEIFKEGLDTRI